jgi:hypothetical protein
MAWRGPERGPYTVAIKAKVITNAARKISTVGGSLKDVQELAGHANLRTTQRNIDANPDAQVRVVGLV